MCPCKCLIKLLAATLFLLIGTVVTTGFSVLLEKLGDDEAASFFGWIASGVGILLLVCFIFLVFASVVRQIFSDFQENAAQKDAEEEE